jgi:hypothetical protein
MRIGEVHGDPQCPRLAIGHLHNGSPIPAHPYKTFLREFVRDVSIVRVEAESTDEARMNDSTELGEVLRYFPQVTLPVVLVMKIRRTSRAQKLREAGTPPPRRWLVS